MTTTYALIIVAIGVVVVFIVACRSFERMGYDHGFERGRIRARLEIIDAKRKALASLEKKDFLSISESVTKAMLLRMREQGAFDEPPQDPDSR